MLISIKMKESSLVFKLMIIGIRNKTSKYNDMLVIILVLCLSFSSISSSDEQLTLDTTLEQETLNQIIKNKNPSDVPESLSDIQTQLVELLKQTNTFPSENLTGVSELLKKTNDSSDERSDLILLILLTLLQRTNELTTQTNYLSATTSELTIKTSNLLTRTNDLSGQINNLSTRTNELTTQSTALLTRTNELTTQTSNITNNPVPIGYVYVQYPNMPVPTTLWPAVGWTQITANYAGLFFRAEGGNSNAFTSGIQTAQSPRITRMEFTGNNVPNSNNVGLSYNTNEFTSAWLQTGGWSGSWCQIRFRTMNADVIPRNRAIRIWTRSA